MRQAAGLRESSKGLLAGAPAGGGERCQDVIAASERLARSLFSPLWNAGIAFFSRPLAQ